MPKFEITGTVTMKHGFTAWVEMDDADDLWNKSWSDFQDVSLDDDDDPRPDYETDDVEEVEDE